MSTLLNNFLSGLRDNNGTFLGSSAEAVSNRQKFIGLIQTAEDFKAFGQCSAEEITAIMAEESMQDKVQVFKETVYESFADNLHNASLIDLASEQGYNNPKWVAFVKSAAMEYIIDQTIDTYGTYSSSSLKYGGTLTARLVNLDNGSYLDKSILNSPKMQEMYPTIIKSSNDLFAVDKRIPDKTILHAALKFDPLKTNIQNWHKKNNNCFNQCSKEAQEVIASILPIPIHRSAAEAFKPAKPTLRETINKALAECMRQYGEMQFGGNISHRTGKSKVQAFQTLMETSSLSDDELNRYVKDIFLNDTKEGSIRETAFKEVKAMLESPVDTSTSISQQIESTMMRH